MKKLLDHIISRKGQIAILIDPDKSSDESQLNSIINKAEFAGVDYFFVGGSTVSSVDFRKTVDHIKSNSSLPVIIFPGGSHQVSEKADGLLFLSLISGRNPDFLIGHHIQAAQEVFDMDIEVIPTGYLLIEGGTSSSVAYVSQTTPIPAENESIILNTCKAGILLGKQVLFLDAGSGAKQSVPAHIINKVTSLGNPVIVGGGIRTPEQIEEFKAAGANIIVIGNKIEEDIDFLLDIRHYIENDLNG